MQIEEFELQSDQVAKKSYRTPMQALIQDLDDMRMSLEECNEVFSSLTNTRIVAVEQQRDANNGIETYSIGEIDELRGQIESLVQGWMKMKSQ